MNNLAKHKRISNRFEDLRVSVACFFVGVKSPSGLVRGHELLFSSRFGGECSHGREHEAVRRGLNVR